ncbi:MAG: hypothetical protein EPO62_01635 [Candidatus Nitrosotenuis sp.]|nr:MAG: hypothetical protein EPO62_01635 [Candidatus Nitrosotenuis sp.]
MRGLDEILVNAIMQTVKKEISSKGYEGIEQQLQNHGMRVTDMFYRFPEMKKSLFHFTNELKIIEDKILKDFLAIEQEPETSEIWLVIKNQHLTELILKSFADEEKKAIMDLIRDAPETIPKILERCKIPNTSGYRKMNQLIDEKMVVTTGLAETFEGKRAILYKSIIQKMQILISANEIIAKILVDRETLDASEIIRTITEINTNKTKTAAN